MNISDEAVLQFYDPTGVVYWSRIKSLHCCCKTCSSIRTLTSPGLAAVPCKRQHRYHKQTNLHCVFRLFLRQCPHPNLTTCSKLSSANQNPTEATALSEGTSRPTSILKVLSLRSSWKWMAWPLDKPWAVDPPKKRTQQRNWEPSSSSMQCLGFGPYLLFTIVCVILLYHFKSALSHSESIDDVENWSWNLCTSSYHLSVR